MKMIEYATGYFISEGLYNDRVYWFNVVSNELMTWHVDGIDLYCITSLKHVGFPVETLPEHCFREKSEDEKNRICD